MAREIAAPWCAARAAATNGPIESGRASWSAPAYPRPHLLSHTLGRRVRRRLDGAQFRVLPCKQTVREGALLLRHPRVHTLGRCHRGSLGALGLTGKALQSDRRRAP
jgi:hypothetical protein